MMQHSTDWFGLILLFRDTIFSLPVISGYRIDFLDQKVSAVIAYRCLKSQYLQYGIRLVLMPVDQQ